MSTTPLTPGSIGGATADPVVAGDSRFNRLTQTPRPYPNRPYISLGAQRGAPGTPGTPTATPQAQAPSTPDQAAAPAAPRGGINAPPSVEPDAIRRQPRRPPIQNLPAGFRPFSQADLTPRPVGAPRQPAQQPAPSPAPAQRPAGGSVGAAQPTQLRPLRPAIPVRSPQEILAGLMAAANAGGGLQSQNGGGLRSNVRGGGLQAIGAVDSAPGSIPGIRNGLTPQIPITPNPFGGAGVINPSQVPISLTPGGLTGLEMFKGMLR